MPPIRSTPPGYADFYSSSRRDDKNSAAAGHLAETATEIIANPDAGYGLEQALIEAMRLPRQ
jgi:hypothetical protein